MFVSFLNGVVRSPNIIEVWQNDRYDWYTYILYDYIISDIYIYTYYLDK